MTENRTFLFRAITIHPVRIVYGYYIHFDPMGYIVEKKDRNDFLPLKENFNGVAIDHQTLNQYTGCVDSKGVKVFEQDIVTLCTLEGKIDGIVRFSKENYRWEIELESIGFVMSLKEAEKLGFEVRYNENDFLITPYVEYRTKDTI